MGSLLSDFFFNSLNRFAHPRSSLIPPTARVTQYSCPIARHSAHTTPFTRRTFRIHAPHNGSAILHQTGHGGTLRIDKPAPKPTEDKPKPTKPSAKPLSRLEQLRRANTE